VQQIVDSKSADSFSDMLLQSTLDSMKVVRCPKCELPVQCPTMVERMEVACGKCKFVFCNLCKDPYHYRISCEEVKLLLQEQIKRNEKRGRSQTLLKNRLQELTASMAAIAAISSPCPGCFSPVEKNEGCDHMTCLKCKKEFCWKCLAFFEKTAQRGLTHVGPCNKANRIDRANALRQQWSTQPQSVQVKEETLICDGCATSPIQGKYYTCVHCKAFALCEKCETNTNHPKEHVFKEGKQSHS